MDEPKDGWSNGLCLSELNKLALALYRVATSEDCPVETQDSAKALVARAIENHLKRWPQDAGYFA